MDPDVARLVAQARRRTGLSLNDVVNHALRESLGRSDESLPRKKLTTSAPDLGACRIESLESINQAIAFAEGESFR